MNKIFDPQRDITQLNQYLFWDVDLEQFEPERYQSFLAKRIATKGQFSDILWYFKHFGKEQFLQTVFSERDIPEDVRNFWEQYKKYVLEA